MGGVGESITAVLFCFLGGVMNSTWPLFCKSESPKLIRIATSPGWQWENVWLLFIFWSCALNIILCVSVVGPSTLSAVYRHASATDLALLCIFSFLWGSGTACFSLGIQMLGAGPGTALVMSLLVVIGTLLPLIEDDRDDAVSPAALVTMLGLIFAISGFVTSAQSGRIKARAIAALRQQQHADAGVGGRLNSTVDLGADGDPEVGATKVNVAQGSSYPSEGGGGVSATRGDITTKKSSQGGGGVGTNGIELANSRYVSGVSDGDNGTLNRIHVQSGSSTDRVADRSVSGVPEISEKQTIDRKDVGSHHWTGVAVCVTGAVMSSMLQFAFVYGEPLITHAEDQEGASGAAAPLVVWLIAFSLAGVWNVVYAGYLLWKNDTWGRYTWAGVGDAWGKLLRLTVMSVFFIGHIHLYGVAQFLFGGLGPVIAWPLLMSSTVLSGQLWSVFMKEWVGVPKLAMHVNILSISLLVVAVTVIAIAGSVL